MACGAGAGERSCEAASEAQSNARRPARCWVSDDREEVGALACCGTTGFQPPEAAAPGRRCRRKALRSCPAEFNLLPLALWRNVAARIAHSDFES